MTEEQPDRPIDPLPEVQSLAGDELEAFLEKVGADELAEMYEDLTGNDCGCDKRKEWINKQHQRLIDWWNNIKMWCSYYTGW